MFRKRATANGSAQPDNVELIETGVQDSSSPDTSTRLNMPGPAALTFPPAAVSQATASQPAGFMRRSNMPTMSEQSIVLRGGRHAKGLARMGLPKGALLLYWDDLYHTLLNMPRYRFLASFFTVYLLLYLVFAFFYVAFPAHCFGFEEIPFGTAFWFSTWTASTIGYSKDVGPDPYCHGLNAMITLQIMVAALVDTMLMSLVFSRFAAPMPRASTIRFSTHMVLARQAGSPYWALTVRVANIRKHSLLDPEVTLLLAVPRGQGSVSFRFVPLTIDDPITQSVNLKLGLPAQLTHVVDPTSPLYHLSLAAMEQQGMELLCFMSGTDPMTSNMLQAQHTWHSSDIRMNERFVGIQLATNRAGRLGIDLSDFDATTAAEGMGFRGDSQALLVPVPSRGVGQSPDAVRSHMQELRMRTLASLSGDDHDYASDKASEDGREGLAITTAGGGRVPSRAGTPPPPLPVALPASFNPDPNPLAATPGGKAGAAVPLLPLSPSTGAAAVPAAAAATGGLTVSGQLQQWDASVKALCEAVAADGGVAMVVRQQAMALHAALMAVPSASQPLTPTGRQAGGSTSSAVKPDFLS